MPAAIAVVWGGFAAGVTAVTALLVTDCPGLVDKLPMIGSAFLTAAVGKWMHSGRSKQV